MNGPASDVLDAVWNWRSIREFHTASFFMRIRSTRTLGRVFSSCRDTRESCSLDAIRWLLFGGHCLQGPVCRSADVSFSSYEREAFWPVKCFEKSLNCSLVKMTLFFDFCSGRA